MQKISLKFKENRNIIVSKARKLEIEKKEKLNKAVASKYSNGFFGFEIFISCCLSEGFVYPRQRDLNSEARKT